MKKRKKLYIAVAIILIFLIWFFEWSGFFGISIGLEGYRNKKTGVCSSIPSQTSGVISSLLESMIYDKDDSCVYELIEGK